MLHAAAAGTGEVIGYVSCVVYDEPQPWAKICHIYVEPAHRGRGIGDALVHGILRHVAAVAPQAAGEIWLCVLDRNTQALSWYWRLGFLAMGIRAKSLNPGGTRRAVLVSMRRCIGGVAGPHAGRRRGLFG